MRPTDGIALAHAFLRAAASHPMARPRLLSLAAGGVFVDRSGIELLFYAGGTLLILAGVLGLALFRHTRFGA